MQRFIIKDSTDEENEFMIDKLVEYNLSKVPLTQYEKFVWINKVIKNNDGNIIGGISSKMYCWNCVYIDALWVDKDYRHKSLGSILIKETEKIAKDNNCNLIHLDTFDVQAKDFYIKHGYEVFAVLENCPENHKRYYMKKLLK